MPIDATPKKTANNLGFSTFRKIIPSGSESAVIAIINESAVLIAIPLSSNTFTMGMTPAALEYKGTPIKTAIGTAKGLEGPAILVSKFAGA